MDPVVLSRLAVQQARSVKRDVVIIDTAGRLAIDNTLMEELVRIRDSVKPDNVLFVCDAMIGQDAVVTAKEFDRLLDFTGFVLTKLDGDARGGAALSIKAVTGKPIKFLGQGEGLDALEEFRPEGLAQRILGMGDIVGLVQDFEKHVVDKDEAERDAKRMLKGQFGYDDFVKQLNMLKKMGDLKSLLGRIPGMSGLIDQIPEEALDEREMDRTVAIIHSMTKQERKFPEVLDDSRFRRIAGGCGRSFEDVEALHQRFLQARQMMAGMGGMMGGGGFPGMGGMPGMPGFGGGGAPDPRKKESAQDRIARRKKQKQARKARKKNRKK